jgi:hypothetical protein
MQNKRQVRVEEGRKEGGGREGDEERESTK